jgi:hypothetical protein
VVAGTPVVKYLSLYSISDNQWLSQGGDITSGKTLRIYYVVSDAQTPSSQLTVSISYRPSGGSWTTVPATYFQTWDYWYYDWVLPGGATLGLYDVKVDVATPDLRSTTSTTPNAFNVV